MPTFLCLGKQVHLHQADLDRAPQSLLAEAWGATVDNAAVSLSAWPENDLQILQARRVDGDTVLLRKGLPIYAVSSNLIVV